MHSIGSDVSHSAHTVILASEQHALCFCAASKFPGLARSRAAAKVFFNEPYGLENTRGTFIYM